MQNHQVFVLFSEIHPSRILVLVKLGVYTYYLAQVKEPVSEGSKDFTLVLIAFKIEASPPFSPIY
jgi:hypothetical protein